MLAERVIEWTRNWKDEGIEQGRQEARQEAQAQLLQTRQEAQTQLLQTMLEARFGPLPNWALARLKESSSAEVEHWCLRILSQASLQEVLD